MFERLKQYATALKAIALMLTLAGAFGSGMVVESWKKDKELAKIELTQKIDEIANMKKAADDLSKASLNMQKAAESAMNINKVSNEKLNVIAEGIKKFKPLPVDCKPDVTRVRNLETAIDAANSSIP